MSVDPEAEATRLFSYRPSREDVAVLSACFDRFPDSIPVGVKVDASRKSARFEVHPQAKTLLMAAHEGRPSYERERERMVKQGQLPQRLSAMPVLCEKQNLGDLCVTQRLGHESTQGKVFLLTHKKKSVQCALKASPLASPGLYELFSAAEASLEAKNGSSIAAEKCYHTALRAIHAPRDVTSLFKKDGDKRASKDSVERVRDWLVSEIRRSWFDLETEPSIEALNAFSASKMVSDGLSFFHPRMIACFRGFECALPKKRDQEAVAKVSKHTTTGKVMTVREAFASCGNGKIDEAIANAYVPTQYLVMEKLDGFLTGLPESFYDRGKNFRWDRLASILGMIVVGLALGQKHIGFVSNDAHWSNIGYFKVPQDSVVRIHLPKNEEGESEVLEIPTHGYLLCIIDGGRCAVDIYSNKISFASGFMELYGLKEVTINNKHADLVRTAWECTKLLRDRDAFEWTKSSMMPLTGNGASVHYLRKYVLKWEHMNNIKNNPHAEACIALIQSWRTVRVPEDYETKAFAKVEELVKAHGGRYMTLDHDVDRKAVRKAVMGSTRTATNAEDKSVLGLSNWLNKSKNEPLAVGYPMDLEDYKRCIKDEYMRAFAKTDEFNKMIADDDQIKKKSEALDYQANSDAFIFSTVDYRAKVLGFDADPVASLRKLVPLYGVAEPKKGSDRIVFSYKL